MKYRLIARERIISTETMQPIIDDNGLRAIDSIMAGKIHNVPASADKWTLKNKLIEEFRQMYPEFRIDTAMSTLEMVKA